MNAAALKRQAVGEHYRRAAVRAGTFSVELACDRHLKQLALARDPSKRIAACCGRRAGKSTALCARAIDVCTKIENATVYYCTKSYTWARNTIIEPILRPMLERQGIVVHEDRAELVFEFPNGSKLYFLAADDLGDIKKFNGKKMHLCIVDEMQDLSEDVLEEFLQVIVNYCLYDYDGTLILAGIPSEAPAGYWFKVWQNPSYAKHVFTAFDNPMRAPEETQRWVDAECREHGVTVDHPLIQRSVFAVWVPMTDWLVYKYDGVRNGTDCRYFRTVTKDTVGWRFAIGVDTGSLDRTAVVVIGQGRKEPACHLVDEWVTSHGADLDFSAIVSKLLEYRTTYNPQMWFFDSAHAGKPLMAELRNRHGFPLEMSALKAQMKGQVELVNDGLRQGTIKIPPESSVAEDMLKTAWDKDFALKNKWEYSTAWHPDPSEAFRYAYQGIYQTWYRAPDMRSAEQKVLDEERERLERAVGAHLLGDIEADDIEEHFMPVNPWR